MKQSSVFIWGVCLSILFGLGKPSLAQESRFPSHPPSRPLPTASNRPIASGPALFVDPVRGNDANVGSRGNPWKSLNHAIARLKPGDTLLLRGGRYYEHVLIPVSGTAKKPVTIRSHPGELAIVDGGIRECFENPATSWEPAPGGAEGEFRSTKTYPGLRGDKTAGPLLAGRFADSMIPLQGYLYRGDLASTNEYWNIQAGKTTSELEIYCGPGVWYDPATERIQIRLAHTNWKFLSEEDRYRGETDPRKLPLIIAAHAEKSPLFIEKASHVRLQDLVVVGAGLRGTVRISGCENIELDGVTVYGGSRAVAVDHTSRLRFVNSACRGIAAPWTYRGHLKYRSAEARLFSDGGWMSEGNSEFELAYSEFTDSVDGVFIGNVAGVDFHHNVLDNISDDGIFLTATTGYDGKTHGGNTRIYQNLLSRCLTTFAFGVGHGRQKTIEGGKQTGGGVWIYRNIFDFRKPVPYVNPQSPEKTEVTHGRVAADHGSPTWEPMYIYHNTFIAYDSPWRGYYPMSSAMGGGTQRRVFNNIFAYGVGMPGAFLEPPLTDFQADGNLHWSFAKEAMPGEFLARFRSSELFEQSRKSYPPGWTTNDRFADPRFASFNGDWRQPFDLGLRAESPSINAGVAIPSEWPDPLRKADKEKPDLGALSIGAAPGRIGIKGRFSSFGKMLGDAPSTELATSPAFPKTNHPKRALRTLKPVAILDGYPTEDPAVVRFILGKMGVSYETFGFQKGWLDTREYPKYSVIAVVGWLVRAGVTPNVYTEEDLKNVRAFLDEGGTLLLSHDLLNVFNSTAGMEFLSTLLQRPVKPGESMVKREFQSATILKPTHPWVKHLDPKHPPRWLEKFVPPNVVQPLPTATGENIIGSSAGESLLYRLPIGKGQLIYFGWQMSTFLPQGRGSIPTVEQEKNWEENYQLLENILSDVCRRPTR